MSRFVLTAQLQLQAPNNVAQVVKQIQNQLNGVQVNVQVQGSQRAQKQLQQITSQTNQAATAAERMGKAFAISVRRFAAFSIATRAVGLFTSTLSDAVQTAIDFERQLIKVSQVTGESIGRLRGLTSSITELATGMGVASNDLLEVSTLLLQAGVSSKETTVALKTLAKAALAPNFDSLSETTEGAIAILAQFQEGVGSLEKQLGSINAVAGAFAVEAGDLIDVIRRTGGVFKSSGGNLNELLALFTSVRATTRESAESIGTGLRTIFTRIQRPKTIEFLKQFGVELIDLEGKFIGPFEAVRKLSEALSGLGEGDVTFIRIAEELGGFRQIGKVLPLLQQFATAQSALNVANEAGNSLTQDAITAQGALAVRIVKVREEFLALVRSVTETQTFQIFANTSLQLASALIKVADSIKPLLPLLGALAAVKIAKGLSSFAGGILGGLGSARTFNKGGKVHHFARGGMVPGSGNRDTVPAMLQPGEFVIRKSSVNKLGAGNLAAMNENRHAAGGIVHSRRGFYGDIGPDGRSLVGKTRGLTLDEAIANRIPRSALSRAFGKQAVDAKLGVATEAQAKTEKQKTRKRKGLSGEISINPSAIGGFFLRPNKGTERDYKINRTVSLEDGKYSLTGNINGFYTGKNDIAGGSIGKIVREEASNSLRQSIKSVATSIQSRNLVNVPPIDGNEKIFEKSVSNLFKEGGAQSTIEGYMLEGIVSALSGATLAGGQSSFDYPSSSLNPTVKERLASIFRSSGEVNSLIKADAKRTGSPNNYRGIGDKLVTDIKRGNTEGLSVKKFATGGGVGTDTVPALLTPGEFVVNRQSAQNIGYGALNRMNKVGRYAKGGVVQRFATGTTGTGVSPIITGGDGIIPFDTLSRQARNLANIQAQLASSTQKATQAQNEFGTATQASAQSQNAHADSVSSSANVFSDFGFILATATATLQSLLPPIDKNSSFFLRLAESTLKTLTAFGAIFSILNQFGVNLKAVDLLSINKLTDKLGSGFDFVGKKLSSLAGDFSKGITSTYASLFNYNKATVVATVASSSAAAASTASAAASRVSATADLAEASASKVAAQADLEEAVCSKATCSGGSPAGPGGATPGTSGTSRVGSALAGFTMGVTVAATAVSIFSSAIRSSIEANKQVAIEAGDVEAAAKTGSDSAGANVAEGFMWLGTAIGSIIGGIAGGVAGSAAPVVGTATGAAAGSAVGGVAGAVVGRGLGNVVAPTSGILAGATEAVASARAVRSQRALEKSANETSQAMQSLANGTMSFDQAMRSVIEPTKEIVELQKATAIANEAANINLGGFSRTLGAWATLGFVDNLDERKTKAKSANEARNKELQSKQNELITRIQPAISSQQRRVAMGGGDFDDFIDSLDEQTFELFNKSSGGVEQLYRSFINVQKEVDKARKAFEALNLDMRGASATASAASSSLSSFIKNLEPGSVPAEQAIAIIETSFTEAAQALNPGILNAAVRDVASVLSDFGASEGVVQQFTDNVAAFATIQASYNDIFNGIKEDFTKTDFQNLTDTGLQDKFAQNLDKQLEKAGIDKTVRGKFKDIVNNIDLSDDERSRLRNGDVSVFSKYITEAAQKSIEQVKKIVEERVSIEKQLIELTRRRIDAERNLVQAQQEALDLYLEGREVQAGAGGKAVSEGERRGVILGKSNAQGDRLGLSSLKTGSADELRRRNREITTGAAAFEQRARVETGLQGVPGEEALQNQKDLQQAFKTQVDTIRSLIKLEQEELKLIQEKNKLEKESLESLIKGDVEKFFEQQAAVGATAAIATGNQDLVNAFGADAVGGAYENIKRQQEAGVQSLFGMNLAGPGGLVEASAGAALSSRGINDASSAAMLAGTSPEEEASKARIRELGGVLSETGQVAVDMARMELNTAEIIIQEANLRLEDVNQRGRAAAAAMSRGGTVYASNGIFVPKGTDTVPAMLTPGEFVVNRNAVNRGNNLQILQTMNRGSNVSASTATGYKKGGRVNYLSTGGVASGSTSSPISIDPKAVSDLSNALNNFNTQLKDNILSLQNTKFQIKLDTTNVNVNLSGGSFLQNLTQSLKKELLEHVGKEISSYKVGQNGQLQKSSSVL